MKTFHLGGNKPLSRGFAAHSSPAQTMLRGGADGGQAVVVLPRQAAGTITGLCWPNQAAGAPVRRRRAVFLRGRWCLYLSHWENPCLGAGCRRRDGPLALPGVSSPPVPGKREMKGPSEAKREQLGDSGRSRAEGFAVNSHSSYKQCINCFINLLFLHHGKHSSIYIFLSAHKPDR